jgi:streptogramin lyase/predicted Ser/Thr protein kinase
MGLVYRARQLSLDRTVALKVIAPALTQDPAMRRRFLRESRVAASIDHPHVIPVYYAGEEGGVAFIAMRFVAGDDLRTLVRGEGRLEPERAVRIVGRVASALDAAHASGLVHRDVKPANVLLGADDHVYLTDFGLTKHVFSEPGAGVTREGEWVGTLDFASPEQIRGDRVDARSDVYALGCLLFYVVAGKPPFPRESDEARLWAHLSEPPPKLSEVAPGAPEALDDVVTRALAKSPEDRYQSAGNLGRAAAAAVSGNRPEQAERVVAAGAAAPIEITTRTGDTRLAPATAISPRPRWRVPRRAAAAAIVAALAALAALVLILATHGSRAGNAPTARRAPRSTPSATPSHPELKSVHLRGRTNYIAAVGGWIWAGAFRHSRLQAIDPQSVRAVRSRSATTGFGLSGISVTGDTMWVILARDRRLLHLDGRTGRRIGAPIALPGFARAVAADRHTVWVSLTPPGIQTADRLYAFDAKTGAVNRTQPVPAGVRRLVLYRGALWMLSSERAYLARLDLHTGTLRRQALNVEISSDLTAADGALWATEVDANRVVRVNARTWNQTAYAVGREPAGVVVRHGSVWVANYASSTVSELDPRTGRTRSEIAVPLNPYELTTYHDDIWVTSHATGRVTRIRVRGE